MLYSIPKEKVPFTTIHVGYHVGHQKRLSAHVRDIIDALTKFIQLYSFKATTSEEVIKHLRNYFYFYSRTKHLVS